MIGRRLIDAMPFDAIPPAVERLLRHYLACRRGPAESFAAFARRQTRDDLRAAAETAGNNGPVQPPLTLQPA